MDQIKYTRDDLLYKIVLAEQTERFKDMVDYVHLLVRHNECEELSIDERNLFSLAYKNLIGPKRTAWRIISSIEQHQQSKQNIESIQLVSKQTILNESKNHVLMSYRKVMESELIDICRDVLYLLDTYLLSKTRVNEASIFYLKMRGDYCRYLSEFSTGNERKKVAECALSAYKTANALSVKSLSPTHPIRLGLALNMSVFYYEILNSSQRACNLAKAAFDDAIAELDTLNEEYYKDATLIMQLLRDNLSLWSSPSKTSQRL